MRIENTGINEIRNVNTSIEAKGSDTVKAGNTGQKGSVGWEEQSVYGGHGVASTTVEKALFSLESELEKIKRDAGNIDFDLIKTQMAVLAGSLSGEDIRNLSKEGYSLSDTDAGTIVTVMDKIKMELAKAGKDISGFGDSLSMEQLEAMTGNAVQASQMAADLKECQDGDITYLVENELEPTIENLYWAQHSGSSQSGKGQPLPEDENLRRQMEQMIEQAGLPVNETTFGYGKLLFENQLPLTPENLVYVDRLKNAQLPLPKEAVTQAVSRAVSEGKTPKEAYMLEGYSYEERAEAAWQTVAEADAETVEAVADAGKAVTLENLAQAEQAQAEAKNRTVGQQSAAAGRRTGQQTKAQEEQTTVGQQAKAQEGQTAVGQQTKAGEQAAGSTVEESEGKLLTAKRQLEEIRLMMTVQANYQLLKKGISIETLELEQLVEELKTLENDYYKAMLAGQGIEPTAEHTALFRDTTEQVAALKEYPAYLLGQHSLDSATVEGLCESGRNLQAALEQANEAYDTMMTKPRADLGDSMKKAFRNVDDILQELQLEPTEANRRAVRILAYNEMEINEESIVRIKAADEKVQNLFEDMKPAVVLEMIREGINPLQTDIETLSQKAEEIAGRLDPGQEEKYSKYLWTLEQNKEITPEEKESYIGIYRLLRQIEKTDGAAIGAVLNQGGELSLKNLLGAVRSRQKRGMDVTVDEQFGAAEAVNRKETAIHQQVEAAYQTDCAKDALSRLTPEGIADSVTSGEWQELTPEQLLEQLTKQQKSEETTAREERYYQQQSARMGEGQKAEDAVLKLLDDYQMPFDTWHILAAGQMVSNRNSVYNKLFDKEWMEKDPDLQAAKETLLEEFAEAVKTPEDMAKAQMALAETAERVMETMINDKDATSQSVRDLKVLRTQIQLGGAMSREENYAVPVLIADEMTNVQLKIVRGKKTRGMVDVLFETEKLGKVAARFTVTEQRLEGFVSSDRADTLEQLKQKEERLFGELTENAEKHTQMEYSLQQNLSLSDFTKGSRNRPDPEQSKEDYQVQTRDLYAMAKAFIETVKQAG